MSGKLVFECPSCHDYRAGVAAEPVECHLDVVSWKCECARCHREWIEHFKLTYDGYSEKRGTFKYEYDKSGREIHCAPLPY